MQYVIVENRTTVLLGPVAWRPRFIQSEFDDLGIGFVVPPSEQGYMAIDAFIGNDSATGIEIFPITDIKQPAFDYLYETLAGPIYTYQEQSAICEFHIVSLDINSVQENLEKLGADCRYRRENIGITVVLPGHNTAVTVHTDRVSRANYFDLVNTIDSETTLWKFPEGFRQLDKPAIKKLISDVRFHVQLQFDWEHRTQLQIRSAESLEQLRAVGDSIKQYDLETQQITENRRDL